MSDKMLVKSEINSASHEELEIIARELFNENPDEIAQNILDIQKWINGTPHLKNIRQDELFLCVPT